MVNNKKLIIVTPSGRKQYLEILKEYILNAKCVDEWHLWVNTTDTGDLEYIESLAKEHEGFIVLQRITPTHSMEPVMRQWNLHNFYKFCQEDAVYIRIDDDICWMEVDAIERLALFRMNNPEPFIVYPNIINNSLMSYLQVRMGNIPTSAGIPRYETFDEVSLKSSHFFDLVHTSFLEGLDNVDRYKFKEWKLFDNEHHSITVSAFLGSTMKARDGVITENDEIQLNVDIPREIGVPNTVYGEVVFVHHQYYYQRQGLIERGEDPNKYLAQYFELSKLNK